VHSFPLESAFLTRLKTCIATLLLATKNADMVDNDTGDLEGPKGKTRDAVWGFWYNPTETLLRVPSRCQPAGPAGTWPRERRTLPTWWAEQCVDGCGAVHPWSWRTVVARCRLLEPEIQNHNARTSTANQLTKLSLLYMIFMNSKKNYPTWMCTFFYNMFTSFRNSNIGKISICRQVSSKRCR